MSHSDGSLPVPDAIVSPPPAAEGPAEVPGVEVPGPRPTSAPEFGPVSRAAVRAALVAQAGPSALDTLGGRLGVFAAALLLVLFAGLVLGATAGPAGGFGQTAGPAPTLPLPQTGPHGHGSHR